MGLIKAFTGAGGGVLADQWREYFYCDSLDANVLVKKGSKRTSSRSSNKKGEENIISNGSIIAVADGQCMMIVEQGKVVEICAEPGEFTYDTSTEPSIFYGGLGKGIIESFKTFGKRFTFGGDTAKDQRIYYFNTKEIMDNKFGTPVPIMFDVVNKQIGIRRTVQVRCNGIYSYIIQNPVLFYARVCGNVEDEFTRDRIDNQLKTEFIDALVPAFGMLSEQELRPSQISAKTKELKTAMNETLKSEWLETRGISIEKIALNPITLSDEDMKKINEMEDSASYGANAFMASGRMTTATANAMEAAASNPNGAVNAFMGMGMVGGAGNAGFGAAQNFYNMGVQQQAERAAAESAANAWKCACGAAATGKFCPECGAKKPEVKAENTWKCACGAEVSGNFCPECGAKKPEDGWTCTCGKVNRGKFCPECGAKKPSDAPLYQCDKCGWKPEDPKNPPKFCPECGDIFNDNDAK